MPSRRGFLATAAGCSVAVASSSAAGQTTDYNGAERIPLDGEWDFRLDPKGAWRTVIVPHTWQIEAANTEHMGAGWYRRQFDAPAGFADRAVRIEFEAAFHTATVWLNEVEIGQHTGKGYTAFTVDAGRHLRPGAANTLLVRVDNSFNDAMLPRGRSSDWAHDGGLYRPVSLLVTPKGVH